MINVDGVFSTAVLIVDTVNNWKFEQANQLAIYVARLRSWTTTLAVAG